MILLCLSVNTSIHSSNCNITVLVVVVVAIVVLLCIELLAVTLSNSSD